MEQSVAFYQNVLGLNTVVYDQTFFSNDNLESWIKKSNWSRCF
jgi:catechol 2,3-dioxygenase-like lactoylglutathione lyase family enzyme